MITQEYLKVLFAYNPDSGIFLHRVSYKRIKEGQEAGSITCQGYRVLSIDGKRYFAHILAFIYMEGYFPKYKDVDHINGIRDDNRWSNLRIATRQENLRNSNIRVDNTSGTKGVCWSKKDCKWLARIHVDGKQIYLGSFSEIEDAILARKEAEITYFGEFNKTNPVKRFYENSKIAYKIKH